MSLIHCYSCDKVGQAVTKPNGGISCADCGQEFVELIDIDDDDESEAEDEDEQDEEKENSQQRQEQKEFDKKSVSLFLNSK